MTTILRRQDVANAQLVEGYETSENLAGSLNSVEPKHITDIVLMPSFDCNELWHNGLTHTRCNREVPFSRTIFGSFDKKTSLKKSVDCPLCLAALNDQHPTQHVACTKVERSWAPDIRESMSMTLQNICYTNERMIEIVYEVCIVSISGLFAPVAPLLDKCILCVLGCPHTRHTLGIHAFFKPSVVILRCSVEQLR